MKNDDEKLDRMITLLEGFTFELSKEEQDALVTWLKELRETRARETARHKQQIMRVLMDRELGCHGLTKEEAERVWAKFGAKEMPETESGPCRLCEGRGKVSRILSTDCWGNNMTERDRCFTCNGSGTDPNRIKVPEA